MPFNSIETFQFNLSQYDYYPLYIDVFSNNEKKFLIEMLNVSGEVVYSLSQVNNADRIELKTDLFANGMYILKVEAIEYKKFWTEKIYINR